MGLKINRNEVIHLQSSQKSLKVIMKKRGLNIPILQPCSKIGEILNDVRFYALFAQRTFSYLDRQKAFKK